MNKIIEAYKKTGLVLKIVIGLVVGVILGLVIPQFTFISIFGTLFVGALKAIAPLLVFALVVSAILGAKKGGIGSRFKTVIFFYIVSTLLAAVAAVISSYLFPITLKLTDAVENQNPPQGISEVLGNLLTNMVMNPITAITSANYIGILFWSVLFGIALKAVSSEETGTAMKQISDSISQIVKWIIQLAPFGIMGLVFETISTNGISVFAGYGRLLCVLVGCMLFIALVIDPLIAGVALKRNPYPLVFKCLKESGITAFFTRSSAANIPVNMNLCEKLGLDKDFYSVCIPLGATINMDGAAITITVMTLAAANTLGIAVDFPSALILSVLATLGACGASGVAGGSLLLIPMACSLFGISNDIAMQVVGVGFIIGVIQDSFETAINSSGDVMFCATAEFTEWIKKGKEIKF